MFLNANNAAPQGNASSFDMSGADLSSAMGGVLATSGLLIGFEYDRVKLVSDGVADRHETRLVIIKQGRGDRSSMVREFITEQDAARWFPQEYAMFKQTGSTPTTGTPIDELPGISRSDVLQMEIIGVRSIEDMVSMGPDLASQNGRDALRIFNLATEWVKRSKDGADVKEAAELRTLLADREEAALREATQKDREILALQAKLEALTAHGGAIANAAPQAAVQPVETGETMENLPPLFDESDHVDGDDLNLADDPVLG